MIDIHKICVENVSFIFVENVLNVITWSGWEPGGIGYRISWLSRAGSPKVKVKYPRLGPGVAPNGSRLASAENPGAVPNEIPLIRVEYPGLYPNGMQQFFFRKVITPYPFDIFQLLTPISDQDRISPNNTNIISTRLVMKIKKNINLGIIS